MRSPLYLDWEDVFPLFQYVGTFQKKFNFVQKIENKGSSGQLQLVSIQAYLKYKVLNDMLDDLISNFQFV